MKAIVNIKQVPVEKVPARQQRAWNEFLDMLMERAEAKINEDGAGEAPSLPAPERGEKWKPNLQ